MKKTCFLLIFSVVLILCACSNKPVTFEQKEKQEKQSGQEEQEPESDNLDNINMSDEHIEVQLGKRLKVNAYITPQDFYKDGLYNYAYDPSEIIPIHDREEEHLLEVINGYYGKEVITMDVLERDKDENTMVTSGRFGLTWPEGDSLSFSLEGSATERLLNAGQYVSRPLSKLIIPEDKKKVETYMTKIAEYFGYLVDYDLDKNYYAIHFNEQFYQREQELYGISAATQETLIEDNEIPEKYQEFYFVRCQQMVDEKIPIDLGYSISFPVEQAGDVEGDVEVQYGRAYYVTLYATEMTFDKNFLLQNIRVSTGLHLKERLECVPIKNIREMLEILKTELGNGMQQTEIYSIKLVYNSYLSEERDKNGKRKLYLAPYWKVEYHRENETHCCSILYLATTGEKVYDREG